MELILTHDNADFDAVASQLGAHKLMPEATPVIPARLNRNVRHFIQLYWDELPYIRLDDINRKDRVTQVTVVDTQTVQTVRGMDEDTQVAIIDHHDRREHLDPRYEVTLAETGATATVLTERIREKRSPLTPIEATLLTLGIYEDTGALTYATTTARDAYAAAWLLEQGALLDVVQEFLNHDLSAEQQALFETLQENAEAYDIEGHPVVMATAQAPELVEEIATLAHKLGDLLDPEALFIIVDLGHHVQLVARASTDAFDVGKVAELFDGGGHSRAAAAIVREATLEEAAARILDKLPELVQPSLTVGDLMSQGVQTLAPDDRAREADKQMRRYGYEGFPVVDNGQVIGLLTRRHVDRALDHGLGGVRVEQIMEAGEVKVHPEDSMDALQELMMRSGWGQIPVVDDAGNITGVVTRTDLITHLGHRHPEEGGRRLEMSRLLEEALPAVLMALVRAVGRITSEMDMNVYIVGGGVRDLLVGDMREDVPTPAGIDLDFVVEGNAIELTRRLRTTFGGDMRSHGRFGTGKWLLDDGTWTNIARKLDAALADAEGETVLEDLPRHLDFATARTEFYEAPSALPEVERSSIKHDLHRRDFTINTLAIRIDPQYFGQLLDFYGAVSDLEEGVIRVLHSLSFYDDPTRILRAVRYEQRFGFQIEERTLELAEDAIPVLDRLSGDRIKHEVERILDERSPEQTLCRMDELEVLRALHPDLKCDPWLKAAFKALRYAVNAPLWPALADYVPGTTDSDLELPYFALLVYRLDRAGMHFICERLNVRRRTVNTLDAVHDLRARMDTLSGDVQPSEVVDVLEGRTQQARNDVLVTLWAAAPTMMARAHIERYARELQYVEPLADGETLKERGLPPGPAYSEILGRLREAWLDGDVATAAEEAQLLEDMLKELEMAEE